MDGILSLSMLLGMPLGLMDLSTLMEPMLEEQQQELLLEVPSTLLPICSRDKQTSLFLALLLPLILHRATLPQSNRTWLDLEPMQLPPSSTETDYKLLVQALLISIT
jgi:hypothetical protein